MSNLQELQARAAAAAALDGRKEKQDEARVTIERLETLVSARTNERDGLSSEAQTLKENNQKLMLESAQAESGRKAAEEASKNLEVSQEQTRAEMEQLDQAKQAAEQEVVTLKAEKQAVETEKNGLAEMLEQLVARVEGDAAAAPAPAAPAAVALVAEAEEAEEAEAGEAPALAAVPAEDPAPAPAADSDGKPTKDDAAALVDRIKSRIESNRP